MKSDLKGLQFDTANNAALSLRLVAEWVRTGEVTCAARVGGPGHVSIELVERLVPKARSGS